MNSDGLKLLWGNLMELYVSQHYHLHEWVDHVITIFSTKRRHAVESNYNRIQHTKIFVEFASNVQFWPWIGHFWNWKSLDLTRQTVPRKVFESWTHQRSDQKRQKRSAILYCDTIVTQIRHKYISTNLLKGILDVTSYINSYDKQEARISFDSTDPGIFFISGF